MCACACMCVVLLKCASAVRLQCYSLHIIISNIRWQLHIYTILTCWEIRIDFALLNRFSGYSHFWIVLLMPFVRCCEHYLVCRRGMGREMQENGSKVLLCLRQWGHVREDLEEERERASYVVQWSVWLNVLIPFRYWWILRDETGHLDLLLKKHKKHSGRWDTTFDEVAVS